MLLLRRPPRFSLIRLMMPAAATATTAQDTPTDTADVVPSVASFAAPTASQAAAAMAAANGPTLPQAASMPNLQAKQPQQQQQEQHVQHQHQLAPVGVAAVFGDDLVTPILPPPQSSHSSSSPNISRNHSGPNPLDIMDTNHSTEDEMDDNGKVTPPPSQPPQPRQQRHNSRIQVNRICNRVVVKVMLNNAALVMQHDSARLRRLRKKNLVRTLK
jgi:hypothetical protein